MEKIDEIIEQFQDLDFQMKLELLMEYASQLPQLPSHLQAEKDAGLNRVADCQSPVFIWMELNKEGNVKIYADVAPEAPTVQGFVGILVQAYNNSPPQQIAAAPADILNRMGLSHQLGMLRLNGLYAILKHVRMKAKELME